MKKTCLVYLASPTNAIAAYSAIISKNSPDSVSIYFVIHWPGGDKILVNSIYQTIKILTSQYKSIEKLIQINQDEIDALFKLSNKNVKKSIEKNTNLKNVDQIYFPHDVTGNLYQALCHTYPSAKRICYGDAFGLVFQKFIHLSYIFDSSIITFMKKVGLIKNRIKTKSALQQEYKPDQAILILPIDQSGKFLKKVAYNVVDKRIFKKTLKLSMESIPELNKYSDKLINIYPGKKYLLLTENFAEGNFIDFNSEINMWNEIISTNCPKRSVIFIKPHPGETLERAYHLKKILKKNYQIIKLDKKFSKIPIELWKKLITKSEIISLSYPTISIEYIYNKKVINPMNKKFIKKWFPKKYYRSYINSTNLYKKPLNTLKTWNEKSILWSGSLLR